MCDIFLLGNKSAAPLIDVVIQGPRITCASWSLGNKFIYTGHEDGSLCTWDAKVWFSFNFETGHQLRMVKEHSAAISDFQFSSDKTWFITSSKDHSAKIYDASNLSCIKTYITERPVNSAAISPDRDIVAIFLLILGYSWRRSRGHECHHHFQSSGKI